ncbi:MAG: M23 family metallopeptidase [Elusimicrobia bacterium]|nr:M23 family metallopeptidase [Elusimicrobiota bacterium]
MVVPKEPITFFGSVSDAGSGVKKMFAKWTAGGGIWFSDEKPITGSNWSMTLVPVHSGETAFWLWANDNVDNGTDAPLEPTLSLMVDGSPPEIRINTPTGSVAKIDESSGEATDNIRLKEVRLKIRDDTTGRFWTGSAFEFPAGDPPSIPIVLSGTAAPWGYQTGLLDSQMTHLSSYTIFAQAEDSTGNLSPWVERNFIYDLCSDTGATYPYQQSVPDLGSRPDVVNCVATNCGVSVPILVTSPGHFSLPDMTDRRLRAGIQVRCEKPDTDCEFMRNAYCLRHDNSGDGGYLAPRGSSVHDGFDLEAKTSDIRIPALTSGQVIFVGMMTPESIDPVGFDPRNSYGWIVVVRSDAMISGHWVYTMYAHLIPPPILPTKKPIYGGLPQLVSNGMHVTRGDYIGYVGDTGNAERYVQTGQMRMHVHVSAFLAENRIESPADISRGYVGATYFGDHFGRLKPSITSRRVRFRNLIDPDGFFACSLARDGRCP